MEIILRLEDFKLKKTKKNWIEKSSFISTIIKHIETSVWGKKLNFFYRFKDDEVRLFKTFDVIISSVLENKYDTYVLQNSTAGTSSCGLYLNVNDSGFSLIIFENISQDKLDKSVIEPMINFTIDLYSEFHADFLIGYRLGIELYELKGFTPDDIIINDYWETYKIVDFLSLDYHINSEAGKPDDFKKFSEAKFEPNVKKTKKDDLLIINWDKDTDDKIGQSMMYRDEWIQKNLKS